MTNNIAYTDKPLYVAIVWHHHQPFYKDILHNTYAMPWVRFHATKDYFDMAAILDEFPTLRVTFNFVPSLLIQLDDYANANSTDPLLNLTLKTASQLTKEDKTAILQDFFIAHWTNMIDPYPRYTQLLNKRGRYSTMKELKRISNYFSTQDFLDLQVWFNLTWMDPYWKTHDPFIKGLFVKGENFTEEDKLKLINKIRDICGSIVFKYRSLFEKNIIDISTAAMYHPILPLIIDSAVALESNTRTVLPHVRFQHPEDAEQQIFKAVECFQKLFGVKPKGFWPSEGGISDALIPLLSRYGFKWTASDEGILFKSLPSGSTHDALYKPYKYASIEPPLYLFFRNRELSDAIGFQYASWDPETAVADFLKKLHAIRKSLSTSKDDHIVTIILDGENCWEYYKNDGWDFLKTLYTKLSHDPLLPTTTLSDFLNRYPSFGTIKHVWPGSWINSNFNIWIGHPEDNKAWHYLTETRNFLHQHLQYHPEKKDLPQTQQAWESIYIAEGSDWNWWYGNEHSTPFADDFDKLFRTHLMNVYAFMNERIPDWLFVSIKGTSSNTNTDVPPIDIIKPKIDGKITSYYEWQSAGYYRIAQIGGTMHRTESVLSILYYGFDNTNLYFRFDTKVPLDDILFKTLTFKIVFLHPHKKELIFRINPGGKLKEYALFSSEPFVKIKDLSLFAAQSIIECAVPFDDLDTEETFSVEYMVVVEKNLVELERWPLHDSIHCEKPTRYYKMINWSV